MIQLKLPATSANIGPCFDTVGIALNLYNEIEVELSNELIFENIDDKYKNDNNLFYQSFKKTANLYNKNDMIYMNFKNINIPIGRGLGSSATMIVGGILAANELYSLNLTKNQILDIATNIEGHPDNVSPCIYGGLTINMKVDNKIISRIISLKKKIYITIIIPQYTIETKTAREILPKNIPLNDVVFNIQHSLLLINSLQNGNLDNLKYLIDDRIHVPYRKKLIKDYDNIANICYKSGAKAFTISGSGPTMIAFDDKPNLSKKITLKDNYKIYDLEIDKNGATSIK